MIQNKEYDSDYLSKTNTNCLKGILALCVLAHHLYQDSGLLRDGWLRLIGECFQALGFLSVALFFFMSGYGLTLTVNKNPKSINHFLKHKIIPFYIIYILLIALYSCFNLYLRESTTVISLIKSLTFGGTIVLKGWYLQVQLLYYIFFYIVFRYIKEKQQFLAMLILHILYVVICIAINMSSLFYERTFIFVFGILWYNHRDKIDSFISKKKYRRLIICIVSFLLFSLLYVLSYRIATVLLRGFSYFFLIPLVFLPLKSIRIQNRATIFLGEISFETYVLQGLFLKLFHTENTHISNPYLYILAVTTATIAAACILHPLIQLIYKSFRKTNGAI